MNIVKKIVGAIATVLLTAACATGLIVFVVWIIVSINSCSGNANAEASECPLVTVMEGSEGVPGCEIMVDKETRVMYIHFGHGEHGITALLEADGSPQLWTGELPE